MKAPLFKESCLACHFKFILEYSRTDVLNVGFKKFEEMQKKYLNPTETIKKIII